jgi:hypothetical protein
MTDTPQSLLNVTGKPSNVGAAMVAAQQQALAHLAQGHPAPAHGRDGPQTHEEKMLLAGIAAQTK